MKDVRIMCCPATMIEILNALEHNDYDDEITKEGFLNIVFWRADRRQRVVLMCPFEIADDVLKLGDAK